MSTKSPSSRGTADIFWNQTADKRDRPSPHLTHTAPNLKFSSVDHRWVWLRLAFSYFLRLRLNLADSISVVIFNRVSTRCFLYPIWPRIALRPKSQGPSPFPRPARFLLPCFAQAVNSHSLSNCPCKFPPSVTSIVIASQRGPEQYSSYGLIWKGT